MTDPLAYLVRDFPCLTGAEYDRAVAVIAAATRKGLIE